MEKIPLSFYQQEDVLMLSQQLLGKSLFTYFDKVLTGGRVVETEAHRAPEDRACHAYGMRRTQRNAVMYQAGGVCYVYMCYGLHALFNIRHNVIALLPFRSAITLCLLSPIKKKFPMQF